MASTAQAFANRENATHSTGPTTAEGKATVSENRRTHGLTGRFTLLSWENASEFAQLCESLLAEHQPANDTELRLIDAIAQHHWLAQRAIHLQNQLLEAAVLDHRTFSLYLRYQTTNERAYFRAMRELQTLRKEKRQQEIGFESQKRDQELHEAKVRLTNARAAESEVQTDVRTTMDAPIPGHARIPFEDMANAFRVVLQNLNRDLAAELNKKAA
jgi:hypothetical protein